MSSSPFRATVDMTGEQQSALDLLARRTGRSRNALIREAIDRYLAPPAEAARDAACDGGDHPPLAPVASESCVASAGERPNPDEPCPHPARKGKHEWYASRAGGDVCRACGAHRAARRVSTRWCSPSTHSIRGRE